MRREIWFEVREEPYPVCIQCLNFKYCEVSSARKLKQNATRHAQFRNQGQSCGLGITDVASDIPLRQFFVRKTGQASKIYVLGLKASK